MCTFACTCTCARVYETCVTIVTTTVYDMYTYKLAIFRTESQLTPLQPRRDLRCTYNVPGTLRVFGGYVCAGA